MKIAFSTLACPDWTLDTAAKQAASLGYLGVEMRSFLSPLERMPSDPMSMHPGEVATIFADAGVTPMCLATGVKYDKVIEPPLIGRIFVDEEAGVEDTKRFVDLAARSGIKFVRAYPGRMRASEPKTWSTRRITERLTLAAQTCRNTEVRLLLENEGSFAQAQRLRELIDSADSQWLGASYNILSAVNAGECPTEGVRALGERMRIVRVCDIDEDGNPVALGTGRFPVGKLITALGEMGYDGWIVYEYPKLWKPALTRDSESVLRQAADTLYAWARGEAAPA